MKYNNIKSGINIPEDIYVIIEIPFNSNNIKYEISKEDNIIYVDRFINSTVFYPFNYGYINKTLSLDGDNLDVIIPINYSINIGSVMLCKPIGLIKMQDESGIDNKIIAFPHNKISIEYNNINNIYDIPELIIRKINFFFNTYKKLDNNKFVKINSYEDACSAKKEILESINRFNNINN